MVEGDQGNFATIVTEQRQADTAPMHRECMLRSVLGNVDHLEGRCTCRSGGTVKEYEPMTGQEMRQEGLDVWEWVQKNGHFGG
jgi:hypothetical protein